MSTYEARIFRATIGRRLREHRLRAGLTQDDIAWQVGVSQGSISHYEKGRIEIPLGVLLAFCRLVHVPLAEIVPGVNDLGAGIEATKKRAS